MNAYEIRALKDMGIDPGKLGCVMLDVTTPDLAGVIPDEWCYTSAHPDRFWVSGRQSEGHVTLAYVHEDREQDAVAAIRRHFKARDLFCPINFEPLGLNYGSKR